MSSAQRPAPATAGRRSSELLASSPFSLRAQSPMPLGALAGPHSSASPALSPPMSLKRGRVTDARAGEVSKAAARSLTLSSASSEKGTTTSGGYDSDAVDAGVLVGKLQAFAQEAKVAVAPPTRLLPSASAIYKSLVLAIHLMRSLLDRIGHRWTDVEEEAFPDGLTELPLLAYRLNAMAHKLFYSKPWKFPPLNDFSIGQSLGWVTSKFDDCRSKLLARIKASALHYDAKSLEESDKDKGKDKEEEEEEEREEPPTKRARSSSPVNTPPVSFVPLTLEVVRQFCDENASASSDAPSVSSDEIDTGL